MKKLLILTIILNFSFLFCVQNYDYGRIELKNGEYIEGKKLFLSNEYNVDVVKININKYKVIEYNLLDIQTLWKGMPSFYELQKGLIIGSSVGLLVGVINSLSVDRNSRYYSQSDAAGAFGMIPLLGIIGYVIDLNKNSKKYSGITTNWEIIYNSKIVEETKIDNPNTDKYDKLERLFTLKEQGIITDDEYEIEKTKILDSSK
jgi:hypothetical protein